MARFAPLGFTNAVHALAHCPQVVNFMLLVEWESHAYKRSKKLFMTVRKLEDAIYRLNTGNTDVADVANAIWPVVRRARSHMSTACVTTPKALSAILDTMSTVLIVNDVPRMHCRNGGDPHTVNSNDIITHIFGGMWNQTPDTQQHISQVFPHACITSGTWIILPRILRVSYSNMDPLVLDFTPPKTEDDRYCLFGGIRECGRFVGRDDACGSETGWCEALYALVVDPKRTWFGGTIH